MQEEIIPNLKGQVSPNSLKGKNNHFVLVNSSMNTRKKGVFGGVHPQTHLFFGNLVVHTFVDEYKKITLSSPFDNEASYYFLQPSTRYMARADRGLLFRGERWGV